jgi:hypothetical protein
MQTLTVPKFVYCEDCDEVTGWFYDQNHIIATFHEAVEGGG